MMAVNSLCMQMGFYLDDGLPLPYTITLFAFAAYFSFISGRA